MRKRLNLFGVLFAVWGMVILVFWLSTVKSTMDFAANKDGYVRLIELFLVGGILLECLVFMKYGDRWSHKQKAAIIFFIALGIRGISLLFSQYIPSSDFKLYFDGACWFVNNGMRGGMSGELLEKLGSIFAWQTIINGLLLSILSPTLIGMQILNSLYTAGICVFIYLIGRPVNFRGALVGAILYTFYPMSILSTHITTNHHGATFFLVAGVYLFEETIAHREKCWTKNLLLILISALCFAISNFYHPSIVIVLCSLVITMLIDAVMCLFHFRKTYISSLLEDIKQFRGRVLMTIVVIVIYNMIMIVGATILERSGYVETENRRESLGKIVVGLNQETRGSYSEEDYAYVRVHTTEETIKLIKERLSSPKDVIKLMINKTKETWYLDDNYGFFYVLGSYEQISEKTMLTSDAVVVEECTEKYSAINQVVTNMTMVDTLYVNFIWLFVVVGIGILIMQYQGIVRIYSFLFIPMGWMAFITFTEMQSRYRYQSMPAVILLAAWGIICIYDKITLFMSLLQGGGKVE